MQHFSKQDIHPSIFEAIDEMNTQAMSSSLTTEGPTQRAYNAYNSAWFEVHWRGFSAWLLGLVPVIGTIPILRNVFDVSKPVSIGLMFAGLIAWVAAGIWGWERTKKDLTMKELNAIMPALNLSESQTLYLNSVIAVDASTLLDYDQKRSWLQALYQTLDNALSLEKLHDSIRASLGGSSHAELLKEIETLSQRAESAVDPLAKQTFQESLAMAQGRLARSHGMAAQSERIEAQLELTRQTFLQTHESLGSLSVGAQKSIHVSLDPLRANLSRVQAESHEILQAIEELNQM